VVLSDTVGFVSDLPTQLVAAFRATLEEVIEADLIVHVRDVSHPDSEAQAQDVANVLSGLGLADELKRVPMLTVYNKVDAMDPDARAVLAERAGEDAVAVSALTGEGIETLRDQMDILLRAGSHVHDIRLSSSDGRRMAWLHEHGDVIAQTYDSDGVALQVRLSDTDRARFAAL
jgi:GTP-binding protein HflX